MHKLPRPSGRDAQKRCALCEREIANDQEVFGFGVRSRPGADLKNLRGQIIQLTIASLEKDVPAIVTTVDSPAAAEGFDLYLMTCSAGCATELKAALEKDIAGEVSVE